jgi:hypothetical protein
VKVVPIAGINIQSGFQRKLYFSGREKAEQVLAKGDREGSRCLVLSLMKFVKLVQVRQPSLTGIRNNYLQLHIQSVVGMGPQDS